MPTKERTYTDTEIADRLKDLPGWYFEDGWIRRVYKTDGWPTTLMLVNAIGYLAEAAYHHPDLSVTWGRLTVKLSTHSAGGITDKDFELARQIEVTVLWRPAGGLLEGTPNNFVRSGDPRLSVLSDRDGQRSRRAIQCESKGDARPVRHRQAGGTGAAACALGGRSA